MPQCLLRRYALDLKLGHALSDPSGDADVPKGQRQVRRRSSFKTKQSTCNGRSLISAGSSACYNLFVGRPLPSSARLHGVIAGAAIATLSSPGPKYGVHDELPDPGH